MEELLDITKGQKPEGLKSVETDNNGNVTNANTETSSEDRFVYKPAYTRGHNLEAELQSNYYGSLGETVGGLGWTYSDFGESKYDQAAESIGDLQDLNEVRAREQDWYEKVGIGLGKFGIETANTAVGNILGVVVGIGQGIINATDGDDSTTFWQGLWNNEITRFQNEIRDWQEKAMPIYRSKYEQNMGAIRSIFTASGFSDLIAQAGFTSGMLLSAYLTGGMGIASGASSLMKALGASEKAASWVYRLICGITGAVSESSMEGLNNYNDVKQHYTDEINRKYALQSQMINNQIENEVWNELLRRDPAYHTRANRDTALEDSIRQAVTAKYQQQFADLEKNKNTELETVELRALSAGSMTFGLNMVILGASNTLGTLSFLKAPSQNYERQIAKGLGQRIKEIGKKEAAKPYGEGISVAEARMAGLREGLMEGFEESNQKWAANIAEQYYGSSYDPKATDKFSRFLETSLETFKTTYSDPETWKEWAMGAITGLTGVFNLAGLGKLAKGEKVKASDFWQGGMIEAWNEGKKLSDNSRKAYNEMNKFATDKKLQNNVRLALFNIASRDRQIEAAAKGNKMEYEDENDAQAIRIAQTFADAGKLNDFEALVGKNDNLSDEELDALCDGLVIKRPDGKYISDYPYLLTENGEKISTILDKNDPIRQKAKEKIAKESKRLHDVIKQYQDVLNTTDKETGYSLSRDQLGVLTMLKVRKNLSEGRQDDITKKLNGQISWDDIADYLDSYKSTAETNKKALGQKIKRLEQIISNYNKKKEITKLSETDEKNEKIFQSELDKMRLLFEQYDKATKTKTDEEESAELEGKKSSFRIIMEKIKEALSNNDKGGAFLASVLNQNLGTKEKPYFLAESVADALYALYGDDANDMIKQIEDLIKLQRHAYAYDELFRTYIGEPDKIHQMLNKVLSNANDGRIKQKAYNTLKTLTDNEVNNAKLIDDAINSEQDAKDKTKLEEELSKNFLAKQHLDKKRFKEGVIEVLDKIKQSNQDPAFKRLMDNAEHLFEIDNLDMTSALQNSSPNYWYLRAVEEGYDEETADVIKTILNNTIEAIRQLNFSAASSTDKIIQEANKQGKGENTNTGEKVTVPKIETTKLDPKLEKYLNNDKQFIEDVLAHFKEGLQEGFITKTGEATFSTSVVTNGNVAAAAKDDNKKIMLYNFIMAARSFALMQANRKPEATKSLLAAIDTITNIMQNTSKFEGFDYCFDCNAISRYKPSSLEDLKKMFPNSEVTIKEEDNYPEDNALLLQSYFENTTNGLKHKVIFIAKKQKTQAPVENPAANLPVTPATPENLENQAALQAARIKMAEIINKLNKQVFFSEKNHVYYVYQGSDVEGAKALWENVKDKITAENASEYDFAAADVTVSGLYSDYLDTHKTNSTNNNAIYAQEVGDDIDFICREYFKGTPIEAIRNSSNIKTLVTKDEKGNIETDATSEIFKSLDSIKEQIQKIHGQNCIFITEPVNLIATYNTTSNNNSLNRIVAGAPDMIVIDDKGVAHIYDFKGKKTENLISKENPNAYENPATYEVTNDYDGYSVQTFAYAKLLKELGFDKVDLTTTTLIQFDTRPDKPVFKGFANLEIDGRKIVTDVMNGIHSYNFTEASAKHLAQKEEKEKKRREEEAARIQAIKDEAERKKQEEIERKKQEEFEAQKKKQEEEKLAREKAAKEVAEKAKAEREKRAKEQQKTIDELKKNLEEQGDKDSNLDKENKAQVNTDLQSLTPVNHSEEQYGFMFADRLQYNPDAEALGEYKESNDIDVQYLKSQGAYEYNDDGNIKKTSAIYFRDISKERAEWAIQYRKAQGKTDVDANLIPENPVIGMFVQKRDGTMQIVGVLRYNSGSIIGTSADGSKDGVGDSARSMRNSISELIIPDNLFEDRTTEVVINGKKMLQVSMYNRSNQLPNKGKRRRDNTTTTGFVNSKDGVKEINIEAQKNETIEVDGKEYTSIKNKDGKPLTVKFLPGRIQERPRTKEGERDFRPITSVQHINTDFNEAFKSGKLYLGVINSNGVYAIDASGNSFKLPDVEIPNNFKEGANVVIFKGGDGKYKLSLMLGNTIDKDSVQSSNEDIAVKLRNSIYNSTVNDKGEEKTSGIVRDLSALIYANDLGLAQEENIKGNNDQFDNQLRNIFNNLNVAYVKGSASFDLKTNSLSFRIGTVADTDSTAGVKSEKLITLTFGSIKEFNNSREEHIKNAEKLIYDLLSNLGARYSIRLPQFYKNEANTTKESQEAARKYINSIKNLMVTTIANFSTRNTRPVITYDTKSDISRILTENPIKNSVQFGNIDIVFDDDRFHAESEGKILSESAIVNELCTTNVLSAKDLVAKNLNNILNYLYVVSKKFNTFSRDTNDEGYNIKDGVAILTVNKDTNEKILIDLVEQKILSSDKAIEFQEKHKPVTPIVSTPSENKSSKTINIYYGANENADLSNFATRPFTIQESVYNGEQDTEEVKSVTFKSVEAAFQYAKLYHSDMSNAEKEKVANRLLNASGAEAKKIGRSIKNLNVAQWDNESSATMKRLIKASFEQNPQALQRLLATGDAILTHTQDKGKWGTEFPKLLMEVREELKNAQTPQQGQTQTPSAPSTTGRIRKKGVSNTKSRDEKHREGSTNNKVNYAAGTHNIHKLLDNTNLAIATLLKSVIDSNATLEVLTDQEYTERFGGSIGVTYKGRVYLRESSTENTMIHELCHYVVPSITQNLEAASELKEVFNQFKRYLELHPELRDEVSYDGVAVDYATTNLSEFLSELFSNEKTAEILKSIPDDYFVYDEIERQDNINPKYSDDAGFVDNAKVAENASKKSLLHRIIDSIIKFFKTETRRTQYVNNLYKVAEKAGKELIQSFNKTNAPVEREHKIDANYRRAKQNYQNSTKTKTKQQEFNRNIHKIMPSREYSLETKQAFSRMNDAGVLNKGFNLAKAVSQNNTNNTLFELFKEILPTVYQKDMTKEDIESYIDKYYDVMYGYDTTENSKNLFNLVNALQNYTLVLPLTKYMVSEKNGNKKFGYSNLDTIFASELDNQIEKCTL